MDQSRRGKVSFTKLFTSSIRDLRVGASNPNHIRNNRNPGNNERVRASRSAPTCSIPATEKSVADSRESASNVSEQGECLRNVELNTRLDPVIGDNLEPDQDPLICSIPLQKSVSLGETEEGLDTAPIQESNSSVVETDSVDSGPVRVGVETLGKTGGCCSNRELVDLLVSAPFREVKKSKSCEENLEAQPKSHSGEVGVVLKSQREFRNRLCRGRGFSKKFNKDAAPLVGRARDFETLSLNVTKTETSDGDSHEGYLPHASASHPNIPLNSRSDNCIKELCIQRTDTETSFKCRADFASENLATKTSVRSDDFAGDSSVTCNKVIDLSAQLFDPADVESPVSSSGTFCTADNSQEVTIYSSFEVLPAISEKTCDTHTGRFEDSERDLNNTEDSAWEGKSSKDLEEIVSKKLKQFRAESDNIELGTSSSNCALFRDESSSGQDVSGQVVKAETKGLDLGGKNSAFGDCEILKTPSESVEEVFVSKSEDWDAEEKIKQYSTLSSPTDTLDATPVERCCAGDHNPEVKLSSAKQEEVTGNFDDCVKSKFYGRFRSKGSQQQQSHPSKTDDKKVSVSKETEDKLPKQLQGLNLNEGTSPSALDEVEESARTPSFEVSNTKSVGVKLPSAVSGRGRGRARRGLEQTKSVGQLVGKQSDIVKDAISGTELSYDTCNAPNVNRGAQVLKNKSKETVRKDSVQFGGKQLDEKSSAAVSPSEKGLERFSKEVWSVESVVPTKGKQFEEVGGAKSANVAAKKKKKKKSKRRTSSGQDSVVSGEGNRSRNRSGHSVGSLTKTRSPKDKDLVERKRSESRNDTGEQLTVVDNRIKNQERRGVRKPKSLGKGQNTSTVNSGDTHAVNSRGQFKDNWSKTDNLRSCGESSCSRHEPELGDVQSLTKQGFGRSDGQERIPERQIQIVKGKDNNDNRSSRNHEESDESSRSLRKGQVISRAQSESYFSRNSERRCAGKSDKSLRILKSDLEADVPSSVCCEANFSRNRGERHSSRSKESVRSLKSDSGIEFRPRFLGETQSRSKLENSSGRSERSFANSKSDFDKENSRVDKEIHQHRTQKERHPERSDKSSKSCQESSGPSNWCSRDFQTSANSRQLTTYPEAYSYCPQSAPQESLCRGQQQQRHAECETITDRLETKLSLRSPTEERSQPRSSRPSKKQFPREDYSSPNFVFESGLYGWSEKSSPALFEDIPPPPRPSRVALSSQQITENLGKDIITQRGVRERVAHWIDSQPHPKYASQSDYPEDIFPISQHSRGDRAPSDILNHQLRHDKHRMSGDYQHSMVFQQDKRNEFDENSNIVDLKTAYQVETSTVCMVECQAPQPPPQARCPSPASCEDFFPARGCYPAGSTPHQWNHSPSDKRKVSPRDDNQRFKIVRGSIHRHPSPHGGDNCYTRPDQAYYRPGQTSTLRGSPPYNYNRHPHFGHNQGKPFQVGSFMSPIRPPEADTRSNFTSDRVHADLRSPTQPIEFGRYSPNQFGMPPPRPPTPPGFRSMDGIPFRQRHPFPTGPRFLSPRSDLSPPMSLSPAPPAQMTPAAQNESMQVHTGSLTSSESDKLCIVEVLNDRLLKGPKISPELLPGTEAKAMERGVTDAGVGGKPKQTFVLPNNETVTLLKKKTYVGRGRGKVRNSDSFDSRPGSSLSAPRSGSSTPSSIYPILSKSSEMIRTSSPCQSFASAESGDLLTETVVAETEVNRSPQGKGIERNAVLENLEKLSSASREISGSVSSSLELPQETSSQSESYSCISSSKSDVSLSVKVCSQSDNDSFGFPVENSDLNISGASETAETKYVVDDRGLCSESDPDYSDAETRRVQPAGEKYLHRPAIKLCWRKSAMSPSPTGPETTRSSRLCRQESPYSSYSPLPRGRGISPMTFDKHCNMRGNEKQVNTTPVKVLRRGETLPSTSQEVQAVKTMEICAPSLKGKALFPKGEPGIKRQSSMFEQASMVKNLERITSCDKKTSNVEVKEPNPVDWFNQGSPPPVTAPPEEYSQPSWKVQGQVGYNEWASKYGEQESVVNPPIGPQYCPGLASAGLMSGATSHQGKNPVRTGMWNKMMKSESQKEMAKNWRRSTGSMPSGTNTNNTKRKSWSSALGTKTYLYMPEPRSALQEIEQPRPIGNRSYSWGSLNELTDASLSDLGQSPARTWKTQFRAKLDTSDVKYVDSHCHIDFLWKRMNFRGSWTKFQMVHGDTFMNNYEGCVTNFCDPNSFKENGMWRHIIEEDGVWAAFGCHPKSATDYTDEREAFLKRIIHNHKVVALGEIGLDYSRGFDASKECQKEVFVRQLKIAIENKMPLVIHCREAENDCLSLMTEHVPKDYTIHRHCFTGHWYELQPWLEYFPKCYVGLTPLVTFRSAVSVHDVARRLPLERLLLETDAPYFRPPYVPADEMNYSTPGMAICVAHEVARLKGIDMDIVLEHARRNTLQMYGV